MEGEYGKGHQKVSGGHAICLCMRAPLDKSRRSGESGADEGAEIKEGYWEPCITTLKNKLWSGVVAYYSIGAVWVRYECVSVAALKGV